MTVPIKKEKDSSCKTCKKSVKQKHACVCKQAHLAGACRAGQFQSYLLRCGGRVPRARACRQVLHYSIASQITALSCNLQLMHEPDSRKAQVDTGKNGGRASIADSAYSTFA